MDYKGKLYGKIGNKYFDTGQTSDDYDDLINRIEELDKIIIRFIERKAKRLNNET